MWLLPTSLRHIRGTHVCERHIVLWIQRGEALLGAIETLEEQALVAEDLEYAELSALVSES